MTLRFGLTEKTIAEINDVLAQHPEVDQAILYGSRAKGNYRRGSDIDLTLVGESDLTLNVLFRIMDEIDDLLHPYMVDLSIFRHISDPDVIDHIQRVGALFYQKADPAIQTTQAHAEPDPVTI